MITYLDSPEDVIACSVRNGFSSTELAGLISRLEQRLEAHGKTHMFLEFDRLQGVDWHGVAEQLPRGLRLIGKLDRLGRIAVVSDDKWIRLWTRAESALLPNVSYELFNVRERDRALNWVQGRVDQPHEAALSAIRTDDPSVLAFQIDGAVTVADMDMAVADFGPRLEGSEGPVRVLVRVGQLAFPSFSALCKDRYLDLKKDTLERVERYAVVGGPKWLQAAVKASAPVLGFEIRYFAPSDEAAAWQWLGASPLTSEAPAVALRVTAPA